MRDSHTLTRLHGINLIDSPANVKPIYALTANNVIGDAGGRLWQARQPQSRIAFGPDADPVISMGVLDAHATTGLPPRLVIQRGRSLQYADSPDYGSVSDYADWDPPADYPRFDYAQVVSTLFFSSRTTNGQVLPGEGFVRPGGWPQSPPPTVILSTTQPNVTIQRAGGVVTVTFAAPHGHFAGDPVYADADSSGTWTPDFGGLYKVTGIPSPTEVTYAQPGLPDFGPVTRAVFPEGLTATVGYQYRVSWGDSIGDWSTASTPTAVIGPLAGVGPVLLSPLPPSPLITQATLWRNLDDGGDWYLDSVWPIDSASPFPGQVAMADTRTDDSLADEIQTPPYDNGQMPKARYLMPFLDRLLACGIAGDEKAVRYSGFESIPYGRPQNTWPQFNRITIGEGQTAPVGMGATRYGPVIFGDNRALYQVRGALQDITTSAVTALSFRVDEYKFGIGLYSHFSIQSLPMGVLFLDDSLRLMIFDGYDQPQEAAPVLRGVFARVTPGSRDRIASSHFRILDRDWYVLALPVDGSVTPNLTVILDVNQDDVRSSGAWVTSYSIDAIASVLNSDQTRHLLFAQSQPFPTPDPPNPAITEMVWDFAPGQPLMPNASYRGGFLGIKDEDGVDEWAYFKIFRFLRYMSAGKFSVTAYLVDETEYTFDNPLVIPFEELDSLFSVNWKSRALSAEILFPDDGDGEPVSGVTVNWNFCGKR